MHTKENCLTSKEVTPVAKVLPNLTNSPITHIDVNRLCHNFSVMEKFSVKAKASSCDAFFANPFLPEKFGRKENESFEWPSQIAVVKADAYGHGHIETTLALIKQGVRVFASGSIIEACSLRQGLGDKGKNIVIISLLGILNEEDLELCLENGIIPLIHSLPQITLLEKTSQTLPIIIKCDTGLSRLGFNKEEVSLVIERLRILENILPVLAFSHLHSANTENAQKEIKTQALLFADRIKELRAVWPHIAVSLSNSAGTFFAEEIRSYIGAHICRIGISLYGVNPFYGTSFTQLAQNLLPVMRVSAPILTIRSLAENCGIGYGHSHIAQKETPFAVIACGYSNGYSQQLSNKGQVFIEDRLVPIIGRIAMEMSTIDLSTIDFHSTGMSLENLMGKHVWLLGSPCDSGIRAEELALTWGVISNEVLCLLGYNKRLYTSFD